MLLCVRFLLITVLVNVTSNVQMFIMILVNVTSNVQMFIMILAKVTSNVQMFMILVKVTTNIYAVQQDTQCSLDE